MMGIFSRFKLPVILLLLGIILQSVSVGVRGVRYGQDSNDYFSCFDDVRADGYTAFIFKNRINKYFFYCFTGGTLLKLFGSRDFAVKTLIFLQILAAGSIPCLLFLTLRRTSPSAAVCAALFAFILPDFYGWTPYLLTDTFFFFANACILLVVSKIHYLNRFPQLFAAAFLIFLCTVTRVTGLMFSLFLGMILVLFYYASGFHKSRMVAVKKMGFFLCGFGLIPVVIFYVVGLSGGGILSNKGVDFIDNISLGNIFYGLEGGPRVDIHTSEGGFVFVMDMLKLFAARAFYFFMPAYNHHSLRHQLINTVIFLPLYVFAIRGVYAVIRKRLKVYYLPVIAAGAMIVYHMFINMYVNVEPDHRFLIPVFPGIIMLASLGFCSFFYGEKITRASSVQGLQSR